MAEPFIAVAGATGQLGRLIALELRRLNKPTKALVRPNTDSNRTAALREAGVAIAEVSLDDIPMLTHHLKGATTVVSSLQGLGDVMLGVQGTLLDASVAAGVKRFIPSDFSLDFTKCAPGSNRNLDFRREFHKKLDASGIAWTSILNGAFTDLLLGTMPFINDNRHRVIYVGSPDQKLDFTTIPDTAKYTAQVAADDKPTPKFLRIAGDSVSTKEMAAAASRVKGAEYTPMWTGPVWFLDFMIRVLRFFGNENAVFPAWQGMQYMANMFSGYGKLDPLDNDRYPGMQWTTIEAFLTQNAKKGSQD